MTGKRLSGNQKSLESGRTSEQPRNLAGVPSMPPGLPERAQQEWSRVVALLAARGDLSELDQAPLGDYCVCAVRLAELEADITKRGVLVKGQRGLVKNPSVQISREYRTALARWADALGLTPASRNRMTLPEPASASEDAILD